MNTYLSNRGIVVNGRCEQYARCSLLAFYDRRRLFAPLQSRVCGAQLCRLYPTQGSGEMPRSDKLVTCLTFTEYNRSRAVGNLAIVTSLGTTNCRATMPPAEKDGPRSSVRPQRTYRACYPCRAVRANRHSEANSSARRSAVSETQTSPGTDRVSDAAENSGSASAASRPQYPPSSRASQMSSTWIRPRPVDHHISLTSLHHAAGRPSRDYPAHKPKDTRMDQRITTQAKRRIPAAVKTPS